VSEARATTAGNSKALAVLLELEKRARAAATREQLQFLIVNETVALLPYRQAALLSPRLKVQALSGLAVPDPNAPYVLWCQRVAGTWRARAQTACLAAGDLPPDLAAEWGQWWPRHLMWVPLHGHGVLMLAMDAAPEAWQSRLLEYLVDAYGHALAALAGRRGRRARTGGGGARGSGRWLVLGVLAVLLGVGFIPVDDSALGQAEVVAREPVMVRAPIDGVIDALHVRPQQVVEAGALLFSLDETRLRSRLQAGLKEFEVADAEFRLAQQMALFDREAGARQQILEARREQVEAEVRYLDALLARTQVRASHAGVVIFDNVNDWLGRPVAIGETVMQIADPTDTEVEVRLAVKDAIALPAQARVRVFLNVDPNRPRDARLRYASYQAIAGADGILAYRLLAEPLPGEQPMRVGQKGTAKLYGERTRLAYTLLRRPLTSLRQTFGW
jgi:hypothetical protein